jgi:hypothetical protein
VVAPQLVRQSVRRRTDIVAVAFLEAGMRTLAMVLALEALPLSAVLSAQQAPIGLGLTGTAPRVATQPRITAPQAGATRRTRTFEGAIIGFVVGTTVTVIVTRSGGSTAPCNRSANQDALSSGECLALAAAGGFAGAGLGAFIGSRIRVSALQRLPPPRVGGSGLRSQLVVAAVSIGAPPNQRLKLPAGLALLPRVAGRR